MAGSSYSDYFFQMLACPCRLCLNLLISHSICFSFLLSSRPHLPLSLAHYLVLGFAFFSVGFKLRQCLSNVMRKMASCSSKLNGLYGGSEASVHPISWRDSGWIWKLLLASPGIYRTGTDPDLVVCPLLYGGMGRGRL